MEERRTTLRKIMRSLAEKDPKVKELHRFVEQMGLGDIPVDTAPSNTHPEYDPETRSIRLGYMAYSLEVGNPRLLALTLLHEALHSHKARFGELPTWYLNLYWAKKLLGNRGVVELMKNYGLYPNPMEKIRRQIRKTLMLMKMYRRGGYRYEVEKRSEQDLQAVRWMMKRGILPRREFVDRWKEDDVTLSEVLPVLLGKLRLKKRS